MEDAYENGRRLGAVVLERPECRAAWHASQDCRKADPVPIGPLHSRHPVQTVAGSAAAVSLRVSDPSGPEPEITPADPASRLLVADEGREAPARVNGEP